jgi:hypothetical protein
MSFSTQISIKSFKKFTNLTKELIGNIYLFQSNTKPVKTNI